MKPITQNKLANIEYEVLEKIESYLIAVGFVPKKNSYLDFVSREE